MIEPFVAPRRTGKIVLVEAQRHELARAEDRKRQDGSDARGIVFSSYCGRCAAPFEIMVPIKGGGELGSVLHRRGPPKVKIIHPEELTR